MPEPDPRADAPMARAWRATLAKPAARIGLAIAGTAFLLAVYAPFLAGEVAIAWWHDGSLRFPVLADLFNASSYAKPHDLAFNLLALLLPLFAVGWRLLRRWSALRRLALAAGILAAATVVCALPLLPGGRAIWDRRPPSPCTSQAAATLAAAGAARGWVLPLIPHRYDSTWPGQVLQGPLVLNPATGSRFWLGTDSRGRCVAALMVMGARISLTVGLVATGIGLLLGVLIGAVSGYFGGKVDLVLQRLVEMMMCFPTFILILAVVAMTGRDIMIIMLVIGLTGWADTARLVRGEFLAQSARDYVLAVESLGLPRFRVMFRHILPNALTPLIIGATFGVAGAVGAESGLAFIGLGDPTAASWGGLLEQGRQNIAYAWLIWAPGMAVFILVTALNLVGNALREALDPKAH